MILTSSLLCLSLNIFHESRGEPLEGKVAVAYVTDKRANGNDEKYCQVVFEKNQFSWTTETNQVNFKSQEWLDALNVASTFKNYPDKSLGATHFHNKDASPKWKEHFELLSEIGNHIFYKKRK